MINENPEAENQIDLTGQNIGDYLIIRRLGKGGMADVYLAQQQSLKRNVALKILKPDLARDKSYIERFQREAQSAAKLVQANIVQIHEVGEQDGLHYIAQEYVVGRNLREYIARHGAVKPVMAVNVLRQAALALQKADEFNVIHRDIKPENIMLTPGGEVKVTDFGLARVNDETNHDLTQIGITMGTPLYMSPEQVEGRKLDVRSDIYCLGVTAYHMLAGKPPYEGETALAIAIKHVKNDPEPLSEIRPDVPAELIQLIDQMMAKSIADRPQNAGQLLKEIKNIKIEMDEDWDQLVETLAIETALTKPAVALPESRLAVTRQLQSVMKGNIRSWWSNPATVLTFSVLLILGLLAGLWVSNQYPVHDPLQVTAVDDGDVRRMSSAKDQYEYAVNNYPGSLKYYQAVIDFHDSNNNGEMQNQNRLFIDRAKERMAEIYLENEDWEAARRIYDEFAKADYLERLNVVGHVGLAVVYDRQHMEDEALSELLLISASQIDNLNSFMRRRYDNLIDRYRDRIPGNKLNSSSEVSFQIHPA